MGRSLRVFAGGVGTETNAWSPLPTGISSFDVAGGGASPEERSRITFGSTFAVYQAKAEERRDALVLGSYAFAQPGGLTTSSAWTSLSGRLLDEVAAALPLDAVLLTLHGAMATADLADCELDLVRRLREIVGDTPTIGVLLDLHCKLSLELVAIADVVVTFKEYPHVDADDRAGELYDLVASAATGAIEPTVGIFDCRMVGSYPTTQEPMRGYVRRLREVEREPGVLSVSLAHGFPLGDNPLVTSRVLVTTDRCQRNAEELAARLGHELYARRADVAIRLAPMGQAIAAGVAKGRRSKPVVLADVADNPGSGAPGDATHVLRELLRQGVRDAALALLWDPLVVQIAWDAEIGDDVPLRIGGKVGRGSGAPLDVVGRVRGKVAELIQLWPRRDGSSAEVPSGRAVWLRCDGVDVIVNDVRTQVFGLEVFAAFDAALLHRRLLVVKSKQHFVAAFEPIAEEVVRVSAPGPIPTDVTEIPYRNFDRDAYPWVADPLGVGSRVAVEDQS